MTLITNMIRNQSLSGQVITFKGEVPPINLPQLFNNKKLFSHNITWKINIKKILSKDCFVKFITDKEYYVSVKIFILLIGMM